MRSLWPGQARRRRIAQRLCDERHKFRSAPVIPAAAADVLDPYHWYYFGPGPADAASVPSEAAPLISAADAARLDGAYLGSGPLALAPLIPAEAAEVLDPYHWYWFGSGPLPQ